MKRTVLAVALAAASMLAPATSGAVVDTSNEMNRGVYFSFNQPTSSGHMWGHLVFFQLAGVDSADANAIPAAEFAAEGYAIVNSKVFQIDRQAVSPTAMSMDPIANTIRLNATLTSTSGPVPINVTLVEPASIAVVTPCVNGCVNAWHNPVTNRVSAQYATWTGSIRGGYKVSGSILGETLVGAGYSQAVSGFTSTVVASSP